MALLPEKEVADVSGRNLDAKPYFGFDFRTGGGVGGGDERGGIRNFISSQNFKRTLLTTQEIVISSVCGLFFFCFTVEFFAT